VHGKSVAAKVGVLVAVVSMSVLSTGVARATPPTGGVAFTDLARAQIVDGASVPIEIGTALLSGAYSLAPDGQTGWRRLSGTTVLAVTKGTLTVRKADGCGSKEYVAGQAGVVPAGTYLIENSGSAPLEFYGVFINQPAHAPKPLLGGPTAPAPACSGFQTASAAPTGLSVSHPEASTMVPGMFGYGATLNMPSGKDMYAGFLDFSPGFRSGWISHYPQVNIVSGGVLSYVMARHGKCETSESYHAGQGFYHPAHRHMALNDGKEHVLLTSVYFGLPHDTPAPVIGNIITANDFTQSPPPDCPRLF
jgi:hypothetical protein